ncbi:MAG: patatin-like phospholipase family protein, partial [Rubrivivax sp.]|nr:patatin-like phospholipase family protein [Rubrivivax sp.]
AAAQALAPPTLEQRFERWAAAAWRDGEGEPPARVLLVASEGGGVRAAYWTARVLAELRRTLPQFERQLLVLSGVSGGAVGEAVFAACPRDGLDACVQGFGQADLLTPLVGAWMFEDVLARVLPTSLPHNRWFNRYCLQPGCGFLSRGLWFEQAMERSVPGLKRGITAAGAEGPWLLLNATWVETGDRAIASGVEVEWQGDRFANARDQLAFVSREGRAGVDMPLSAAAHNAARFPFVNAIGRLRDGRGTQAHLADGGYFDNAGAQGAIDVLARLRRWIAEQPACAEGDARCQRQQAWLRRLKPLVIVVQNGVPDTCSTGTPGEQLDCLQRIWQRRAQTAPDAYEPAAPAQAGRWTLFVDALGPLVTLANVAGTGSNGRRAEALLKRECQRFGAGNDGCVLRIAQRSDGGVLYPLGWYLSPTARRALDRQAQERVAQAVQALQR